MAREKPDTSASAWALAGMQHGVVTRRQLLELGFTEEAIEHRLARGRLHPVTRGVYAVGWPQLTRQRRWMMAILVGGETAALSHCSAAACWGIGSERAGEIEISVRRRCDRRRNGMRIRSRPSLPAMDIEVRNGIAVTRPVRTLVDLATVLDAQALERAVNEADKRSLVGPDALREALDDFSGEPGVRPLRELLDHQTFRLSDSELERLFRPIAAAAELPTPQTKTVVNGFEVDFYWPELGLVVETDGLRYHRTASAQARDRLRDQTHTAAGLTCLRFTHRQVRYEPTHVRDILTKTSFRLRAAAGVSRAQGREKPEAPRKR